ncbi:zinc finger protein aebp2-like [Menidia menidia]
MAEGTEQDSPPSSAQHGTGKTTGTGVEGQAVPDLKQEPGDDNEGRADASSGRCTAEGRCINTSPRPGEDDQTPTPGGEPDSLDAGAGGKLDEPERSPVQGSLASGTDFAQEGSRVLKQEQRVGGNVSSSPPADPTKAAEKAEHGGKRPASLELTSSDGEPLSRMDSEDSISSTLMDMDSTASSGRSTPAMLNGGGGTAVGGSAAAGGKPLSYTCCWDHCQLLFSSSPDLAEHIRATHVDGQRGGVFVCLWKGCKVYNTPSTSQSWLQRHMLSHSGDKPFKCVVGGCNATFASQGGLARHVPTHFSSQGSSKASSQGKVKEESPSKAGLSKRRKLRNKYRRSLPRPHDFFDAQTMDAIRHRAICLNLATHIESLGNGHSVVFHSQVIARRKEDSGKVKVLLHWTPEDILPDVWVNEGDRLQLKTKVVHLSQLPTDTAVLLDPSIYRMFF